MHAIRQLLLAQQVKTSTDKRAIKSYEMALSKMRTRNWSDAIAHASDAVEKDNRFVEAYLILADGYGNAGDPKTAYVLSKRLPISPPIFIPRHILKWPNTPCN